MPPQVTVGPWDCCARTMVGAAKAATDAAPPKRTERRVFMSRSFLPPSVKRRRLSPVIRPVAARRASRDVSRFLPLSRSTFLAQLEDQVPGADGAIGRSRGALQGEMHEGRRELDRVLPDPALLGVVGGLAHRRVHRI